MALNNSCQVFYQKRSFIFFRFISQWVMKIVCCFFAPIRMKAIAKPVYFDFGLITLVAILGS